MFMKGALVNQSQVAEEIRFLFLSFQGYTPSHSPPPLKKERKKERNEGKKLRGGDRNIENKQERNFW